MSIPLSVYSAWELRWKVPVGSERSVFNAHPGVLTLQNYLNVIGVTDASGKPLVEDGYFGAKTDSAVQHYQTLNGLTVDGRVGRLTSGKITASCVQLSPSGKQLKAGVLEGQIDAESARYIGAVNFSVPAGFDDSLIQRRVYDKRGTLTSVQRAQWSADVKAGKVPTGAIFLESDIRLAANAVYQVNLSAYDLLVRRNNFLKNFSEVKTVEYADRLALLYHNWPSGADRLAQGFSLPQTRATVNDVIGHDANGKPVYGWIPFGTKFDDGEYVLTQADWAKFYAMGSHSHNHRGKTAQLAYGVPATG